jgi:hypothetical protein
MKAEIRKASALERYIYVLLCPIPLHREEWGIKGSSRISLFTAQWTQWPDLHFRNLRNRGQLKRIVK